MLKTLLNDAWRILGLIVLVVLGVLVIRAYRRSLIESRPERPEDLLGPLEEAYRRGQMSDEEYQRVRRSLEVGKAANREPAENPELHRPPDKPDPGESAPGR